jgi:CRP-like cAMP-binding protein
MSGIGFFIITAGEATVTVAGNEVAKLGTGDHFGELALIADTPRTATVIAQTDLRCYGMTSWEFRHLAEENAAFSWRVLEATARKLITVDSPERQAGVASPSDQAGDR